MIVTLTVNPSLDRTVELDHELLRGEVQRVARNVEEPGGKGVNVTRALVASGAESVAVLPGRYLAREAHGVNPGNGYVRIALVPELDDCVEGAKRIVEYCHR